MNRLPLPWLLYTLINGTNVTVSSEGVACSVTLLFIMLLAVFLCILAFKWRMTKGMGVLVRLFEVAWFSLHPLRTFYSSRCCSYTLYSSSSALDLATNSILVQSKKKLQLIYPDTQKKAFHLQTYLLWGRGIHGRLNDDNEMQTLIKHHCVSITLSDLDFKKKYYVVHVCTLKLLYLLSPSWCHDVINIFRSLKAMPSEWWL